MVLGAGQGVLGVGTTGLLVVGMLEVRMPATRLLGVLVADVLVAGVWMLEEIGPRAGRSGKVGNGRGAGGGGVEITMGHISETLVADPLMQPSDMMVGSDGANATRFRERGAGFKRRIGAIGLVTFWGAASSRVILLDMLVYDDAEERRESESQGSEKMESSIAESIDELLLCADEPDSERLYSLLTRSGLAGVERSAGVPERAKEP